MKKLVAILIMCGVFNLDSIFVQPCKAQDQTILSKNSFNPHIYFGGKIGIAISEGDIKETWENGIGGSAIAGYQLTPNIAFKGEFNLYLHTPKEEKNLFIDP
ncbi:hypothetical protein GF406_01175 [candidate division KSB1 bacterium]|nr:hypothetical protein [candidate division KSB1 bacterium]